MVDVNNEGIHAVEIRPHQAPHFRNIIDILGKEYGYLDVSTFGAGKTHITCGVAATFKLNMIIITPKSTINKMGKVLWNSYYLYYDLSKFKRSRLL
jgi:superfamily II DNA or RNA helicase